MTEDRLTIDWCSILTLIDDRLVFNIDTDRLTIDRAVNIDTNRLTPEHKRSLTGQRSLNALGLEMLEQVLDVVLGAEEDGGSLVDGARLHVEDGEGPGGRQPPRLLHDVRHRDALVQQAQL